MIVAEKQETKIENVSKNFDEDTYLLKSQGWIIIKNLVSKELLVQLNKDLMSMYEVRRKIQINNGIGDQMSGTCHHLIGENNSMEELLDTFALDKLIKHYFSGHYILNSFGAFINHPNDTAYVSKIHRDVRTFAGEFKLLLNVLVMLDDFTLENGATHVLSGSHQFDEKPPEELFFKYSSRITGKAGDVLVFDSNLWHAAGDNTSNQIRKGLTLTFSRPFFKQQLDYPRLLGEEYGKNINGNLRQILGYNARVPADLNEYYQPYEKRFYQGGQG